MRQRRAKIYRKMLHQYHLQFGFREPYQLLLDDTFSLALSRYKISDPLNQFSNVLQSKKIKPLITQCCMQALYALGKEAQGTVDMAKQWERRMCNHREAIDPSECIKQCIGDHNKHRYILASEQGELRRDLRLKVAGLPMMHFTQAVIVLEPMSPLTKEKIENQEDTKLSLPADEAALFKNKPSGVEVDIVGGASAAEEEEVEGVVTVKEEGEGRRRKRKAPNPLSVRKPKRERLSMEEKLKKEQELKKQKQRAAARARMEASKPATEAAESSEGPKRKRRRPNKSSPSTNGSSAGDVGAEVKSLAERVGAVAQEVGAKTKASGAPERQKREKAESNAQKEDVASMSAANGASEAAEPKKKKARSKRLSAEAKAAAAAAATAAESSV